MITLKPSKRRSLNPCARTAVIATSTTKVAATIGRIAATRQRRDPTADRTAPAIDWPPRIVTAASAMRQHLQVISHGESKRHRIERLGNDTLRTERNEMLDFPHLRPGGHEQNRDC